MKEYEVNSPQGTEVKVTQKEMRSVFWRSLFEMAAINYERFQSLGFLFAMTPVIKKLYPDKERRSAAMKRHMAMFNTNPALMNPIVGVAIAMEEKNANGEDTADAINNVKVGLMGPFAGIGDSLFDGTLRPIFAGLGAALALQGSYFGPILFLLLWNVVYFGVRYFSIPYAYRAGVGMLQEAKKTNILQKVSDGAAVLGLMVLGVLVCDWITIKTPVVFNAGQTVIKLQAVLDGIVPGLMPLLAFIVLVVLLRKRISPNKLIIGVFVVALLLSLVKFLAV